MDVAYLVRENDESNDGMDEKLRSRWVVEQSACCSPDMQDLGQGYERGGEFDESFQDN